MTFHEWGDEVTLIYAHRFTRHKMTKTPVITTIITIINICTLLDLFNQKSKRFQHSQ